MNNNRIENANTFSSLSSNSSLEGSIYLKSNFLTYKDTLIQIGLATEYYFGERFGEVDFQQVPIRTSVSFTSIPIYLNIEYNIVEGVNNKLTMGHQFGYYFTRVDQQLYFTTNGVVLPEEYRGSFAKGDYINQGISAKLFHMTYVEKRSFGTGKIIMGLEFGRDIRTNVINNTDNLFIPRFWHMSIYVGTSMSFNIRKRK